MLDIIIDTIIDAVKLLPFLFIAFLIIEIIEHKLNNKSKKIISNSKKYSPIIGSILGVIPQCGFSVMATNLYITRIISLGTLISIYLSTSDEMLPILLSSNTEISVIVKILLIKVVVGIISGYLIDLILRKKNKNKEQKLNYNICDEEHCHCKNNIFKSSIIHTVKTIIFIIFITLILNILVEYVGHDYLSKIFMKDSFFSPFISSLIGLIPNCGASVLITELYLKGAINLSATISGLLTGSGISLILLFKSNKNLKENIKIVSLLYAIGVIVGIIIEIVELCL